MASIQIKREGWRRSMIATGNLLVDALALDRHFAHRYSRRPTDDTLRELKKCRRTVAHLVHDYTVSVARYRRAVKASFASRIGSRH